MTDQQPPLADLTAKLVLTVAEARRLTGVGEDAIRAAIHGGELHAVHVGRLIKINREDLDAWRLGLPRATPASSTTVPFRVVRR